MPQNVCSYKMEFIIEGEDVLYAKVLGGCIGGSQALARACEKIKNIHDIIETMGGIICPKSKTKQTSCAQQLSYGLYLYLLKINGKELTDFENSIINIIEIKNLKETEEKIMKKNKGYEKRNNFNKF